MYSTKVQNTKVYFSNRNENLKMLTIIANNPKEFFICIILPTNIYLNGEVFVYSAIIHELYYILESRTKLTALSIGFGMMLSYIMTNSSRHTSISQIKNDTKQVSVLLLIYFPRENVKIDTIL